MEHFTGMLTTATHEHKNLLCSTQPRDKEDYVTLVQWLQAHPPFAGYKPDRLVSLSTVIVADAAVNCDYVIDISIAAAL